MYWEGRETLEHREANDAYFGAETERDRVEPDLEDDAGFEDGLDGIYVQGRSLKYEVGWERGNALRRLRSEGKS